LSAECAKVFSPLLGGKNDVVVLLWATATANREGLHQGLEFGRKIESRTREVLRHDAA